MSILKSLIVKLVADTANFEKEFSKAHKTAAEFSKNMEKIGKQVTDVGKTMSVAITAPAIAGFGLAIKSASDMNETVSKSNVIFGDLAGSVQDFTGSAATNLGMSQQAALEAASTFGNLFVSMGSGQQPAADMSTGLVQLAADLASFNNLDPAEVLEKLRSGMVGEVEPLRSLGVNLTQAAVEAKAMEMGLVGANGEISNSALLTARYALIMEQTKTAQGDFARTSDGLANSTRIAKAQLGDMAAQIGTQLLPIAIQLVGVVREALTWFQGLNPETQKTILIVIAIAAAIGPLLIVVGQLITAVGAVIPVVTAVAGILSGPVLLAIGLVAGAIVLLYVGWKNNWLGIQQSVQAAISIIRLVIQAFQAALRGDWSAFGEYLRQAWDVAWTLIKGRVDSAWEGIKGAVSNIIQNVKNFFTQTDWASLGSNIVNGIIQGIKNGATAIANAAKAAAQAALNAAKSLLGIKSPSAAFANIGQQMMAGMAQGISLASKWPETASLQVVNQVTGTFAGNMNPAAAVASPAPGGSSNISDLLGALQGMSAKPMDERKLARYLAQAMNKNGG